jgi:hypothetical protein
MPSNEYYFVTRWRVQSRIEEVADIIDDVASLPRWWPSVYLGVEIVKPGAEHGLGQVVDLYTKGWLPYTLRWRFTKIEERYPNGSTIEATGDFVGRGIWTFEADGAWANITYDWRIYAEKPLLKLLTPLLRPIFRANHRWAMARGEESLRLELLRRRAGSDAERAAIPPPPPPTFVHRSPAR